MARTTGEVADCLYPSCPYKGKRRVRGLCINHYQASLRLVGLGRTTWQELEAKGHVLPARPRATRNPSGRKFVEWALGGAAAPTPARRKARSKRGRA